MVYKRRMEHSYFHKEIASKGQKTKELLHKYVLIVIVDGGANILMLILVCVFQ